MPAQNPMTSSTALKQKHQRAVLQKRHLALYLPQLPLDLWRRRDDVRLGGAFGVTATVSNAERLMSINSKAILAGVKIGMSLTDATAVCPDILTEPQNLVRQRHLLSALQRWADKFSPRVGIEKDDGLALDVTGCSHLFGGEAGLVRAMQDELNDLKIKARIGIANTRSAARGLSRYSSRQHTISRADDEAAIISNLPLEALDLSPDTLINLKRLGLKAISDLSSFRPSELARRFSVSLPLALDALRGHRPDPVIPSAAPKVFAARMNLPEPIGLIDDVNSILERLAERVCTRLHKEAYAALGFQLTVRCVDTGEHHLSIGFASAVRDTASIMRQFRRPLSELTLTFGADWFRLVALNTSIFKPTQIVIGNEAARAEAAIDQTLTTLGNRLGFDRIRCPVRVPSHIPEVEHASHEVGSTRANGSFDAKHLHPRPQRAFRPERLHIIKPGRPPHHFQWRQDRFKLKEAEGPERVAPIWWDAPETWLSGELRDYWRARTTEGRELWLMNCPQKPDLGWFCSGEFV